MTLKKEKTMKKLNANNERIKREYFEFLKEAKQLSEQTLDAVASAINRFEVYNKHKNFKAFYHGQAVGFKNQLSKQTNQKTGKPLSKSTIHAILVNLRNFFEWLYGRPGFKSRFKYSDASYFNLSLKDVRVAQASNTKAPPTIEQVIHTLSRMPKNSAIELRNRALVAFTLLTGARVGALASAKLKHIDLNAGLFMQDAKDVNTKFSKTFPTYFFQVNDEVLQIVIDWIKYLKEELLWGEGDPLFPSTLIEVGESQHFEAAGLARRHWVSTSPARRIFREAFSKADLPNFNPHSFRNTLVQLGQDICQSPEQFKAWSQNLGHEKVLTTFLSYGAIASHRQAEILNGLTAIKSDDQVCDEELVKAIIQGLRNSGMRRRS